MWGLLSGGRHPGLASLRTRGAIRVGFFQLPELPNIAFPGSGSSSRDVSPDDTVAVIGASGNVGRLVALRLADLGACKVRAVARNPDRAAGFFEGLESSVEVFAADTTKPGPELLEAVDGCAALVICTGTTAFPTRWRGRAAISPSFPELLTFVNDAAFPFCVLLLLWTPDSFKLE